MSDTTASSPKPSASFKPDAGKLDPGTLGLRAAPRQIVRFRRGLVIGMIALGAGAILGATIMALQGPMFRMRDQVEELYKDAGTPAPDGLAALPRDYSQIKSDPPRLGPPLPGDLGRPIVERRKQLGIGPGGEEISREQQRLAEQALQAKESEVFFRIEARPSASGGADPQAVSQPQLTGLEAQASPDPVGLGLDGDPNGQQRKLEFLGKRDGGGIYNPHSLRTPASAHQVMAGSVIAASLMTGINSDLPGQVLAQVTENVYDTVTGRTLLIPQGARLIGTYDSVVAFGQSRALLVWQRIILPDGSSIEIDNLPATDMAGYAGLEDEVDFHTWRLVKGVALATLLGVGTELSLGGEESELVRAVREATQTNVSRAGQRITEKSLDIQPTIKIRPGWPLKVIVRKDLVLRPYRG
ncbi:TrbI/VirB10 family protein [Stappia sp. MMSF_3263]|uniref:TrbI/VirB10 family protein n=1 Tax=Stappia sp. MMSF_3263 TaxID=3046693 RepID=UPI00273EBACB|nr:TrbI/VirB10 family protein [Stappia sp. MMSF_3263]